VPLLINGGSFSKASAPPLFLEDENIFQKSASMVAPEIAVEVLIFSRVCMVGCIGRISHTNLKIRMVISRIATSKNHIELLVPCQI
jgi:hypothetical protein